MAMSLVAEPVSPLDSPSLARTRELAMSAAWNGGLVRDLTATDGSTFHIVYRGTWSHGFGPDFVDAMIDVGNGVVRTGAIEIHRAASEWQHHGHHRDPAYNNVILHVVAVNDTSETLTEAGATVPTVVMNVADADLFRITQKLPAIWDQLGHSTCAEHVTRTSPATIRAALNRLGDERFGQRVARFEGDLTTAPVSTLMLLGIAEALGYSQNRAAMRDVANLLDVSGALSRIALEPEPNRAVLSRALLFGAAGYLPLTPGDAHFAGIQPTAVPSIERSWFLERDWFGDRTVPATAWHRARTRPANHPAARLSALASLLAVTHGDLASPLVRAAREEQEIPPHLMQLAAGERTHGLGVARAISITASVVLPLLMAYAHHLDDAELEDTIARQWAKLPRSEWSRTAKRAARQVAGDASLGQIGERGIQGLLHLDRSLCTPRRCHACPVAAEVVRERLRQAAD